MNKKFLVPGLAIAITFFSSTVIGGQFVVELDAPLGPIADDTLSNHAVRLEQSYSAGMDSYAVFEASNQASVQQLLKTAGVNAEKVSEVLFVNSPEIGGGNAAGETPRDGHKVFVIERPIPGVGFFGLDKKRKISKGSNSAIAKLGEIIEWDQSYLTSEGTYCVYRADSPETLREHGALAGAPIGKITAVDQKSFD